jgi:hypothetical protein
MSDLVVQRKSDFGALWTAFDPERSSVRASRTLTFGSRCHAGVQFRFINMNLVETKTGLPISNAKAESTIFPQTKMEMTMRKKILTMLVVPLIAALTAQAAAASEHHHARAKDRAAAWEQLRNSNAYDAPNDNDIAVPSYLSNEANGAMASGIAGH